MIDSFRKKYDVVGLTMNDIDELLGEPEQKYDNNYEYDLGYYTSWFAVDPFFYVITFNTEGIALSDRIYEG